MPGNRQLIGKVVRVEQVVGIEGACRARGSDVTIAAYHRASQRLLDELQAIPALTATAWSPGRRSTGLIGRTRRMLACNLSLFRSVRRLLLARKGDPYDLVFAPTVTMDHLLAWLWLTRRYGGKLFQKGVLFFLNMPGRYEGPQGALRFPRSSRLMRATLNALRPQIAAGRVRLGVETIQAREHMRQFCGIDFDFTPQPASLERTNRAHRNGMGKPVFGCYGFARHEKGSDVLQAALLSILDGGGSLPARFVIQWRDDFADDTGALVRRDPRLLHHPDVEFVDRAFDTAEYTDYLSRTDAIVLPYRRSSYVDRDSRVAIEAAILGIPTLYTRHTWLELCARHCGAGLGVADQDSTDLARGIRQLAENITQYRQEAEGRISLAREYFSPDRFSRWLLDGNAESINGVHRELF